MTDASDSQSELEALVRAIDEDPDPLHADFTPAVNGLIEAGISGAIAVLGLLDAEDRLTRLRAQRVLEGVVMRLHGWRAGQGYPDAAAEARARAVLRENGSYRSAASRQRRRAAIERWRSWLESRGEGAEGAGK